MSRLFHAGSWAIHDAIFHGLHVTRSRTMTAPLRGEGPPLVRGARVVAGARQESACAWWSP